MSNEETHFVISVLEGPVPDGRVYTEITEDQLEILTELAETEHEILRDVRSDLPEDELNYHDEYTEQVWKVVELMRKIRRMK